MQQPAVRVQDEQRVVRVKDPRASYVLQYGRKGDYEEEKRGCAFKAVLAQERGHITNPCLGGEGETVEQWSGEGVGADLHHPTSASDETCNADRCC